MDQPRPEITDLPIPTQTIGRLARGLRETVVAGASAVLKRTSCSSPPRRLLGDGPSWPPTSQTALTNA